MLQEANQKGRNWFKRRMALGAFHGQHLSGNEISEHAAFVADTPLVVPADTPDKSAYTKAFIQGAIEAWKESQTQPDQSSN